MTKVLRCKKRSILLEKTIAKRFVVVYGMSCSSLVQNTKVHSIVPLFFIPFSKNSFAPKQMFDRYYYHDE